MKHSGSTFTLTVFLCLVEYIRPRS